jgi:hypothetical protein
VEEDLGEVLELLSCSTGLQVVWSIGVMQRPIMVMAAIWASFAGKKRERERPRGMRGKEEERRGLLGDSPGGLLRHG